MNFYNYAGNSPVDDSDPYGLQKKKRKPKPKPPTPKCDAIFPHDPTTARLAQLVYGEGNGTSVGDLAIASVVVNRAGYGNNAEFGKGILGAINKGFNATNDPLFNSVSNQAKVCALNPGNCQRYKNAVLASIGAQTADGTNTDAVFYFDESIALPSYITNGIKNGSILPASVDGGPNRITGTYGNPQNFYKYKNFNY
jgi:spore germination cell wall hydrolase CwlJ-like protein